VWVGKAVVLSCVISKNCKKVKNQQWLSCPRMPFDMGRIVLFSSAGFQGSVNMTRSIEGHSMKQLGCAWLALCACTTAMAADDYKIKVDVTQQLLFKCCHESEPDSRFVFESMR
jgi:hypothetical protein